MHDNSLKVWMAQIRAPFLILVQLKGTGGKGEIRALVRQVALRQLGHFMMGTARVKNHSITLSGTYGGDGLTVDVPAVVFNEGVPLPAPIWNAWNKGRNEVVRNWARKRFLKLGPI